MTSGSDTFAGSTAALLPIIWHWLIAYGIALARPMALLSINPVFTRLQLTGLLRGAVATALALPAVPAVAHALEPTHLSAIMLMLLAVKEAVMGATLGLVLGIPFWALAVAGDVLDLQRGASQGRLEDPAGFDDVSITGTFLLLAGTALFVMTGGLQMMASLLYKSWSIWQPLDALPMLDARTPLLLLGLLDDVTRQGLRLALPVILAMLLADVTLIIIGRVVPQLRIDDQATVARNIVFFLFLPVYCIYLLGYVGNDFSRLPRTLDMLRATAGSVSR